MARHFDGETGRFVTSVFERADALLLGRRTWEIFEGYWPHHNEGDPISHGIDQPGESGPRRIDHEVDIPRRSWLAVV